MVPRRHEPPTTVVLVRHGQTPTTGKLLPGRAPGLHLSERGIEQAEAVAGRLAALKRLDAVYVSPLERTRETAAATARVRKLRVRVDKSLIECDFGDWTGGELSKLAKLPEWTAVQRYPSGFRFPNGESFTEMQARIASGVGVLVDRHRGGVIACFSHADPIKALVAHALGTHLDLFQRIVISTCSVTVIAYGRNGASVLTVNSTGGSLAELAPS